MAASHVLLLRGVAAALLLTSAVAFTPPPAIGRSALWPAGSPLATTTRSPARCHGAVVATVRLDRRRRRAAAAAVVLAAADGGGTGEADAADMKTEFERLAAIQRAGKSDKEALAEEYRQALRDQRQRQADAEYVKMQAIKEKMEGEFMAERNSLIGDHVFFSALIAAFIWGVGSVTATFSFGVGSALGLMYLVLLAQFVQKMEEGGGASSGRFAIVFLLILLGGKNKETLDILPLIAGFFTYQLAALAQGLKSLQKA